jgi:hypothetical protein
MANKKHTSNSDGKKALEAKIRKEFAVCFNHKTCMLSHNFPEGHNSNGLAGACNGEIIRAHTISRSNHLSKIQEDGHVSTPAYGHDIGMIPAMDFLKKGTKSASSFYGFCKFHDNKIFEKIDNFSDIQDLNDEFFFVLAYRSLCLELYKKMAVEKSHEKIKATTVKSNRYFDIHEEVNGSSRIELEDIKFLFDNNLAIQDFSLMESICLVLDKNSPVLWSSIYAPQLSIDGAVFIQDLTDLNTKMRPIFSAAIPFQEKTIIIFSWIKNERMDMSEYINDVLMANPENIMDSVLLEILNHAENVFFRKSWIDSISANKKNMIINAMLPFNDFNKKTVVPEKFKAISKNAFGNVLDIFKK